MFQTTSSIEGQCLPVFIHEAHSRGTFIISLPDIHFSIEYPQSLTEEEQIETLVLHLFSMMDENQAEAVAGDIVHAISRK